MGLWIVLGFLIGLALGPYLRAYRISSGPAPTERQTRITIGIEDAGCDSDFRVSWLNSSFLVDESGKRLERVSIVQRAEDLCEGGMILLEALANPTRSWTYSLAVGATDDMLRVVPFTVSDTLAGSDYGPAYVYFSISADCIESTLLCPT